MFFTIVGGVVITLIHVYIWKRLIKDTSPPLGVQRALTGALIVLAMLMLATLFLPRITGMVASGWIAWPGFLWMALSFYCALCLLVVEPVRLLLLRRDAFERPSDSAVVVGDSSPTLEQSVGRFDQSSALDRRRFLARTGAAAAGVASVGLVGYGASSALGAPQMLQVPVRLSRLDSAFNGFRIAVVSDIHLGPLLGRAHTERLVRLINETDADLVAVVGDLVDGTVAELGSAAEPLQDLVSREGTFFVTGNHEYYVDDTEPWLQELDRFGIQTLRNESTVIRRGAAAFDLAGVNDVTGVERADPPDFGRALDGLDSSGPTVLLAHQPILVAEAAARGVDLQISGHTHGGQMWPFQYVVEAVQPALAGLSAVDDTQLYVTRGAGFWGPPVRIGARPDITVLSLQAGG